MSGLLGDNMKSEEDIDFLHTYALDYQEQSSECKYITDVGSHVYPKEAMSPRSEYDRQQPYFPLSSSCWEYSSSLETRTDNQDTSGHGRTRKNIFGPRDDHFTSYPTGPHMRRSYPEAAKVDFSLDCYSEHRYKGFDRFTAFSNCNGQSIVPRNEIVDFSKGTLCMDETSSLSSRWCFENGGQGPSLPRGLAYGDEIPSLSSRSCNGNGVLSRSSPWSYGAEIPSLSSRQGYGDEIPSLSSQKFNGISRSNQWHYGSESPRSQVDRLFVMRSLLCLLKSPMAFHFQDDGSSMMLTFPHSQVDKVTVRIFQHYLPIGATKT